MRVARLFRPVVAAVLLTIGSVAPAGAVPAVVDNADAVNLRRGPGTESQAFAQLQKGQQVEATKVIGKWALVRTQGGAEGWILKQYLTFPGEQPRVEEAEQPTPGRTPPANRAEELQQLHDEVARLTAERDALRAQVASQTPIAAADAPRSDSGRMQADVQQLLQLTQELRQMVASQRDRSGASGSAAAEPASKPTTENESWLLSNGWILTTSLIVGALGGMVYGRAQERRRRNRIRF